MYTEMRFGEEKFVEAQVTALLGSVLVKVNFSEEMFLGRKNESESNQRACFQGFPVVLTSNFVDNLFDELGREDNC